MDQKIGFIYGIIIEDVVVYVGRTINMVKRFNEHHGRIGSLKASPQKLYNALREAIFLSKHWDMIELERCAITDIVARETYWIRHYETAMFGCNSRNDGIGGREPGCQNLSGADHYSFGIRPDSAIAASVAARTGKKLTPEHIAKKRLVRLGQKQPENYIPITCDQNGKTYESQDAAAKDLGMGSHNISFFLNGKTTSAKGFTFKYVDANLEANRATKVAQKPWANHPEGSDKAKASAQARWAKVKGDPEAEKRVSDMMKINSRKANAARANKVERSDGVVFESIAEAGRIMSPENPERGRGGIKRCIAHGYQYKGFGFKKK